MISTENLNTFEDCERYIVKCLTEDLNKIAVKLRKTRKIENAENVIRISEYIGVNYYNDNKGFRLTTEYLNFLIRFYEHKSLNQSREYIKRFLKVFDLKFKDLNISNVYRNYRKLILNRIRDYSYIEDAEDREFFEDCAVNSHVLYSGTNQIHYIDLTI